MTMLTKDSPVFVAGSDSLIGAALVEMLSARGMATVVGGPGEAPDLRRAETVDEFFRHARPEYVLLAAGRSGGIAMNERRPADLMLDNLLVQAHVISAAHRHGVRKLLYLASSCSYPKHCSQPMAVSSLLTGPLEASSEAYAMAKLAGITLCRAFRQQYGARFIAAIPADVFGPGDDFDPESSHVVAGLMRRMHEAKVNGLGAVEVWGTGGARREFLFVDDLADACLFVMEGYDDPDPINLGGGADTSIKELAELIREVVGYAGELRFDATRPQGMPRKSLDAGPLKSLGWSPSTSLREGLTATYRWYASVAGKGPR
jgi:GDP-L-fucose synthase